MYLGSFNADNPIRSDLNPAGVELFTKEQGDLLNDLYEIPQRSCDRKVGVSVSLGTQILLTGISTVPSHVCIRNGLHGSSGAW